MDVCRSVNEFHNFIDLPLATHTNACTQLLYSRFCLQGVNYATHSGLADFISTITCIPLFQPSDY